MSKSTYIRLAVFALAFSNTVAVNGLAGDPETTVSAAVLQDIAKLLQVAIQWQEAYGSFTDPGVWLNVLNFQIFHANLDALFPTLPLLRLSPSLDFYRLTSCPRKDIATCMYYGNATNGLPKELQGIWWQDGVILPEEAISTAGVWDATQRKLTLNTAGNRVWAIHNTNSEKGLLGNLLYLPSGAAHYNTITAYVPSVDIFFNEDITFGQMVLKLPFAFIPISVPLFITNWTMTRLPDGSWDRASTTLGVPSSVGFYVLRQAVDGEGKPGPYYEQWLKDQSGEPFMYGEKVFP